MYHAPQDHKNGDDTIRPALPATGLDANARQATAPGGSQRMCQGTRPVGRSPRKAPAWEGKLVENYRFTACSRGILLKDMEEVEHDPGKEHGVDEGAALKASSFRWRGRDSIVADAGANSRILSGAQAFCS